MSFKFGKQTTLKFVPNTVVDTGISWTSITGSRGYTGPTGASITGPTGSHSEGCTGPTGPLGLSNTGPTGPVGKGYTGPTGPAGYSITGPAGATGESFPSNFKIYNEKISISTNESERIIIHPNGTLQLFGSKSPAIKNMMKLTIKIRQSILPSKSSVAIGIGNFVDVNTDSLAQLHPLQPLPPCVAISYLRFDPEAKLEIGFLNCGDTDQIIDGQFNLFITTFSQ